MRWIGFVVTSAANESIFTPISDANQSTRPLDYWEEHWEDHPAVGNYGVVSDPRLADQIVDDIVRAGFDIIFADERK
jgi:hypothetical protein